MFGPERLARIILCLCCLVSDSLGEALRKPLHKKHRVILALGNDNNSNNDVYSLVFSFSFSFSVYFWKKCDLSEVKQGCVRMAEMMNECKL